MDIKKHQNMFKNSKSKGSAWKDSYRKKCFDRLRMNRANLIDQFRQSTNLDSGNSLQDSSDMIQDIMKIEWNSMKETKSFPSLSKSLDKNWTFSDDSFDEDTLREILSDIEHELASEDERLLNEFLKYDKEDLNSKIKLLQNTEVICPVCQLHPLNETTKMVKMQSSYPGDLPRTPQSPLALERRLILKCVCGLNLSSQDISLNAVKSSIENTIFHHEQYCSSTLVFSKTEDPNGTNVLVTCNTCDWMSFLI